MRSLQEMGLGKTVEVIGCLMSNPWKPANGVPDSPPPEATRAGQDVPDLAGQVGDESAPLPASRTESGELGQRLALSLIHI